MEQAHDAVHEHAGDDDEEGDGGLPDPCADVADQIQCGEFGVGDVFPCGAGDDSLFAHLGFAQAEGGDQRGHSGEQVEVDGEAQRGALGEMGV
jgi:hypothetical protein